MKKHLLTLIFGICSTMLAFTACKKDNDAEPSGSKTVTCLPDTIDFHDKGKLVLEYDSQSQLIKVNKTDKDGKYDGYITFIHTLNKLKELEYNANGKKLLECEHFLNDNGSINYSYEIWSYDDNVRYDTVFYKYNNDDQVILEVRRSGNSIDSTSYVYSDGNLVSSSVKPENRKSIYTVSEHENKYNIFEDRILIPGFYGKGSRNLIVKEVDTIPNYGVMTSTYNYEYNSDGLITSRDFLEMDSNNPDEPYWEVNSTIGYSCK